MHFRETTSLRCNVALLEFENFENNLYFFRSQVRANSQKKVWSEVREASETLRRRFEPRENDFDKLDIKTDCFAVCICKVCTSLATLENCCIFVKWHNSLRTTSERASLYGVLRKEGF